MKSRSDNKVHKERTISLYLSVWIDIVDAGNILITLWLWWVRGLLQVQTTTWWGSKHRSGRQSMSSHTPTFVWQKHCQFFRRLLGHVWIPKSKESDLLLMWVCIDDQNAATQDARQSRSRYLAQWPRCIAAKKLFPASESRRIGKYNSNILFCGLSYTSRTRDVYVRMYRYRANSHWNATRTTL